MDKQKRRDELCAKINSWTNAINYQGLPFTGYEKIIPHRKDHEIVLTAILNFLKEKNYDWSNKSVIDIGSNIGYFPFSFRLKGAGNLYMVERQGCIQNAIREVIEIEELKGIEIINKKLDDLKKAKLIPKCDVVIYKSVHHWVEKFSNADTAEKIFQEITKKADLVIYEPGCFGKAKVSERDLELTKRSGFEVVDVIKDGYKGRPIQVCLR